MNKRRYTLYCGSVILSIALLFYGCRQEGSRKWPSIFDLDEREKDTLKFVELKPTMFENAPVRGSKVTKCTPSLPRDLSWTGIIIRAPERALILADITDELRSKYAYEIPICGGLSVYVPDTPDPVGMRVEITDLASGEITLSKLERSPKPGVNIIRFEPPKAPPGYEPNPEAQEDTPGDQMVQSNFNYNLADYLPLSDIQQTRRYRIRVVLREHRSNAVELEVSRKSK